MFTIKSKSKKAKLFFIVNDSERRLSYNKKKRSVLKMLDELNILRGIESSCAIIYNKFDPHGPQVWPCPLEALSVVKELIRNVPEVAQTWKMLNQESLLKQRILRSTLKPLAKAIKDKKGRQCVNEANGLVDNPLSMYDLTVLEELIGKRLSETFSRMWALHKASIIQNQNQVADGETRQGEEAQVDGGGQMHEMNNVAIQNQPACYLNLFNGGAGNAAMLPFGVNYQNN